MKRGVPLLLIVLLVPTAGANGPATTLRSGSTGNAARVSWLDAEHGWRADRVGVAATDDGGASWRRIYAIPKDLRGEDAIVLAVLRTSLTAGLFLYGEEKDGEAVATAYWTKDSGRRWRRLDRDVRLPGGALGWPVAGSGRYLFAARPAAGTFGPAVGLHRLDPWPVVPLKSRFRLIAQSGTDAFVALATVPGGAAAAVARGSGDASPQVKLLIVQRGQVRTHALPTAAGCPQASACDWSLLVDWPSLALLGADRSTHELQATWRSGDGGRTWKVS